MDFKRRQREFQNFSLNTIAMPAMGTAVYDVHSAARETVTTSPALPSGIVPGKVACGVVFPGKMKYTENSGVADVSDDLI